jgi:short-subunit dehydrogenase
VADPDKLSPPNQGWHLEQDWAGLNPDRDGVTYSASKLKKLGEQLNEELVKLTGMKAGSLNDFTVKADLSDLKILFDDVERWNGGHAFMATVQQGHKEFSEVYQEIIDKLQIAIALVNAGAGIYNGVDYANLGKNAKEA